MSGIVPGSANPTPDKNLGGRPRHEETPTDAGRYQRLLMHYRDARVSVSMLTGEPLTTRGLAYWVYWRDQKYPPGARHGLVPPPGGDDRLLHTLRERAVRDVRRQVLRRVDRYIGAASRGIPVDGVRLRPERAQGPGSYRVASLPGIYWGDVGVPVGDIPGEPTAAMVAAVSDAVEVVALSVRDLEELRRRYAGEIDDLTVAEFVAELLGEHGALSAERVLYRRLRLAREVEFVHLGVADANGITPGGKRLSSGAFERHHRRAA